MAEHKQARSPSEPCDAPHLEHIWSLLLLLSASRRVGFRPRGPTGFTLAPDGTLRTTAVDDASAQLLWNERGLGAAPNQSVVVRDLVDLYSPFLALGRDAGAKIAHLGQSVDSRIATQSGDSYYVTGPENIVHLHRMRALCDAVIVGAGTATADNPRLTTRLVEGPNPVRVVMDPERRISKDTTLLNDGQAPSILVCAADKLLPGDCGDSVIGLPRNASGLALTDLLSALSEQGLETLLIEGGGITVSRWMTAGLLDRLHVSVAPVFIGEGRPAFTLPPALEMSACLRPRTRVFRMGGDVLWDFDLRDADGHAESSTSETPWPVRVI